ncbi:hypothetical protein LAZ67_16000657 [Cordylochernes scorpioides]|uniref:Uncharacterized protein n=1 Tax=Cordylochernes scorpioides TaxID=51811 RepID=A0ABY6LBY8_9ARAC|nr:hypothetical protein LAZ67_16000657 [Cordylochernes scorpioides]
MLQQGNILCKVKMLNQQKICCKVEMLKTLEYLRKKWLSDLSVLQQLLLKCQIILTNICIFSDQFSSGKSVVFGC